MGEKYVSVHGHSFKATKKTKNFQINKTLLTANPLTSSLRFPQKSHCYKNVIFPSDQKT